MSETHDPWVNVRALRPNPYSHENYYVASEVDAARAAEATQHQQEIAELEQRHADELAAVRSSQQLIDQIATLRAERDGLKAALSTAAFALDLAGFRRDRDAAYAALTPQGQSTDGETR